MPRLLWTLLFLLVPSAATAQLANSSELVLPGFQKNILQKDAPLQDMVFVKDSLAMIGKRNLWLWDLIDNKLKRIPLQKDRRASLRSLTTDGINIIAATSDSLYQFSVSERRILRFKSPVQGESLGFSGSADQMWWLHSGAFMRIDRYGRSLIPSVKPPKLSPQDQFFFDGPQQILWLAQANKLIRYDYGKRAGKTKTVMRAKNKFKQIQPTPSGFATHTGKSVLRFSPNGDLIQAIPVDGPRNLIRMDLGTSQDSFLFDDGLLERYQHALKSTEHYALPYSRKALHQISKVLVSARRLAVLQKGEIRVFNLYPIAKPKK